MAKSEKPNRAAAAQLMQQMRGPAPELREVWYRILEDNSLITSSPDGGEHNHGLAWTSLIIPHETLRIVLAALAVSSHPRAPDMEALLGSYLKKLMDEPDGEVIEAKVEIQPGTARASAKVEGAKISVGARLSHE